MTGAQVEAILAATTAAAEAARTANHAAYHAPAGDTGNVYARAGAIYELLCNTEQLVRVLAEHTARLRDASGLFADDATPSAPARADEHARAAVEGLGAAADLIRQAERMVNVAWSEVSHLGRDTGGAE